MTNKNPTLKTAVFIDKHVIWKVFELLMADTFYIIFM